MQKARRSGLSVKVEVRRIEPFQNVIISTLSCYVWNFVWNIRAEKPLPVARQRLLFI